VAPVSTLMSQFDDAVDDDEAVAAAAAQVHATTTAIPVLAYGGKHLDHLLTTTFFGGGH